MKRKNKIQKLIDLLLILNFCFWWVAIAVALVIQNARLFFLFFIVCMISGVVMGIIVFIPFVNEANKDVNPVFGKPKNKKFETKVYGEESDEKQHYDMK